MFKRLLPVMLALTALPVGATTTFTSYTSMTNAPANSGLTFTNVDFSGLATFTPANTFSATGVTFTAVSGTLNGAANMAGWASGMILRTTNGGGTINIALPTGATAFGGYFGFTGSGTWSVTLSGVGDTSFSESASITQTTPFYWGVVSTVEFTSISVSMTGTTKFAAVNGLTFGTPTSGGTSETPEPSTMALVGGGLLLFPLIGRRRARNRLGAAR